MTTLRSIAAALFAVGLFASCAQLAQATTLNLGSIDHTQTLPIGGAAGSDEYDFTVNGNAEFSGTVTTNPFFTGTAVILNLFEAHDLSGFHSAPFDHMDSSIGGALQVTATFDVAVLPGHLYALQIGTVPGYSGSLTFNFAPVAATPIPPALLMFTTGLAGLVGVGWRRRRRPG